MSLDGCDLDRSDYVDVTCPLKQEDGLVDDLDFVFFSSGAAL